MFPERTGSHLPAISLRGFSLPTAQKPASSSPFLAHGLPAANPWLFAAGWVKVHRVCGQSLASWAGEELLAALPDRCPCHPWPQPLARPSQPHLQPRLPPLLRSRVLRSRRRGRHRGWIPPSLPPSLCRLCSAAKPAGSPAATFRLAVSFCWELLNEVALVGPRGVFSSPRVSPCLL